MSVKSVLIQKKMTHLLHQYNVVPTELNLFIWGIKINRTLIHIIINHAAVVQRAEGHNNSLQKLTASLSTNTQFVWLIMPLFLITLISTSTFCPRIVV